MSEKEINIPEFLDKPREYVRLELSEYNRRIAKRNYREFKRGFNTGVVATLIVIVIVLILIHNMALNVG